MSEANSSQEYFSMKETIAILRETLTAKDKSIKEMEGTIAAKDKSITAMKDQIAFHEKLHTANNTNKALSQQLISQLQKRIKYMEDY